MLTRSLKQPEQLLQERDTKLQDIVQIVRKRASTQAEQHAFSLLLDGECELEHLTYRELDRQARTIAAWLQSQHAVGERVLLMYPTGLEFVAAFLGCLYAGAIAVPLYPPRANRSLERFQAVVADAQAVIGLTTAALSERLRSSFADAPVLSALRLQATDALPKPGRAAWTQPEILPERIAFLQYTSGSTAQPKGVMVTHGNLIHNQRMIERSFGHDERSNILSWLPLYHDLGLIGSVILPLYVGCPSILMAPTAFLQRPMRWLEAISRFKATASGGPNFAYELCLRRSTPAERANLDLRSWRVAVNGAETVRAETVQQFSAAFAPAGFSPASFYTSYGMAEATLLVTAAGGSTPVIRAFSGTELARNHVLPAAGSDSRELVGCGATVLDQRVMIVDPQTQRECASDQVGEIWVAGGSVAAGYWQKPELTRERFQAHIAGSGEGPFMRTGDLGFQHQGALFITGRLADLIIIRGRNIYPQDIERTVELCHPLCMPGGAAAFTIERDGEERLVVVQELTRQGSREAPGETIIEAVRHAVAAEHDAEVFAIVLLKAGGLPKTSSGKVQRHACRIGYNAGEMASVSCWQLTRCTQATATPCADHAPPNAELIEEWMLSWIGGKIGRQPATLDATQPFTSFGLDSLALVEMGSALDSWLGRSTRDVMVFDYPTIRLLACHLAERAAPGAANAAGSGDALEGLLAQIEQLSDAEAACALRQATAAGLPPPHE
jgi:acyl-CoA synthetase (AMP-forming)/AMP-acid ligase II/acyl carrier protein